MTTGILIKWFDDNHIQKTQMSYQTYLWLIMDPHYRLANIYCTVYLFNYLLTSTHQTFNVSLIVASWTRYPPRLNTLRLPRRDVLVLASDRTFQDCLIVLSIILSLLMIHFKMRPTSNKLRYLTSHFLTSGWLPKHLIDSGLSRIILCFDTSLMERFSISGLPMSRLDAQRRMSPTFSSLIKQVHV